MDAGLLFWHSGESPDEEDDLYGGEGDEIFGVFEYVDLGAKYGLVGALIERIVFKDDRLELKFSNGAKLLFDEGIDDVGARLIEASSAKSLDRLSPPKSGCASLCPSSAGRSPARSRSSR
jgi:hypothetical protein